MSALCLTAHRNMPILHPVIRPLERQVHLFSKYLDRECRQLHGRYVSKCSRLLETCDLASKNADCVWTKRGGRPVSDTGRTLGGRLLKMTLHEVPPVNLKSSGGS